MTSMDAYEDLQSLGRGSFAVVRLVRKLDTNELFVVKRFHVPLTELNAKERTEVCVHGCDALMRSESKSL